MRKVIIGTLSTAALFLGAVSPAAAAPSQKACGNGPHGTSHGTVHAHHTVPHKNHRAHAAIPRNCSYPD